MDDFNSKFSLLASAEPTGACGYLTVDLSALRRNYAKMASLVAPGSAAAVVKADAYGLGAGPVSNAFYDAGCRHFFVAQFQEAMALRPQLADDGQIFVLNGLQPGNEELAAIHHIVPVLNSFDQVRRWSQMAGKLRTRLPAVLQFDSGMSRLGFPPEDRRELRSLLQSDQGLDILFMMSHLASADEPEHAQNADQLAAVKSICQEFPDLRISLANSAGVFLGDNYHGFLARPGLALYGGAPVGGAANPMQPVIRLDISVIQTRTVNAGARVGYGAAYVASGERRLATLAAGYADGLLRSLSDRGAVFYQGVRLPIVGRVSMDSMTVDVTDLPDNTLSLGSLVEMIGPHQTLEDVAAAAGTIAYEVLTSLGQRYHRRYI